MKIAAIAAGDRADTHAGVVAFHDEGQGPPVLLLHGFPASSWQWREFLPLLAARFRVIAPDLPGAGASTAADGVTLDLEAQAAAMRELMEHLGIQRYAVVGHGAGGGVAQLLALDGDGVDALVLLSPATFDAGSSPGVAQAHGRLRASGATPEIVRELVREAFEAGAIQRHRLSDDVLDAYADPYATGDGPTRFLRVLDGLDGVGPADRAADLAAIDVPVLIFWGEDDPVCPSSLGERLNDAMPSSTLGLLPGCGHFLVEEAPETIGPMISEYLRARYAHAPHGHGDLASGIVMLQLERRPPWVDLEQDERDDWFDPDEAADPRIEGRGGTGA